MAKRQKPITILPPKVYLSSTGETVDMTPELKKIASKRCAEALVKWATGTVMKDMGIG
ncbi:hypothetical protein [Brevibacillus fulvus]|uniref:Uncharacterized protein n=1 Tax=Brevibacillus fulvus TaxID=1125967 RepID=A0A939BRB5_9BACL|nr:hypothetical protein [Brevibacillus fulvus]MBM7589427.1 hypothetical protein [Brevibacillus fulvus]